MFFGETVNYLFHHTLLNDAEIATRIINDCGLQTSLQQVRSIRSLFAGVGLLMAEESLLPAKGLPPGFQTVLIHARGSYSRDSKASRSSPRAFYTSQNSGKRQVKGSLQASDLTGNPPQ